jgi:hypothetical protein
MERICELSNNQGVQFAPESPVQFEPEWGVQFAPEYPIYIDLIKLGFSVQMLKKRRSP